MCLTIPWVAFLHHDMVGIAGNCLSRLGGGGIGGSAVSRDASVRVKKEAIAAYRRAVCCDDREGTATRELARLYRCYAASINIDDSSIYKL